MIHNFIPYIDFTIICLQDYPKHISKKLHHLEKKNSIFFFQKKTKETPPFFQKNAVAKTKKSPLLKQKIAVAKTETSLFCSGSGQKKTPSLK